MQTAFITDWRAVALPVATATGPTPAISIRYFDQAGRQVGTSVTTAADIVAQGRALIAIGEAAILHAAAADGAALPPRHHFPIMRDVRVADAPSPAGTIAIAAAAAAAAKPPVVIYGPRASGKTFHAERFCQRYECTSIFDLGKGSAPAGTSRDNALILTDMTKAAARAWFGRDAHLVSIHDARRAIGVGPVRSLAEWRAR